MSTIIHVTPETIGRDIHGASTPVLLDLWAPWCAPCRALAPTLEKLAAASSNTLQIAKLDVEQYPDVMVQFGVRGIPALLLFSEGEEISREVGVKSYVQLTDWLSKSNIEISPPEGAPVSQALYGAFYGDESLKNFLCERLYQHSVNDEIDVSMMPYWQDGKGTSSAVLVHSGDVEIFTRLTALPAPVALLIESVRSRRPEDIRSLCDALKPGSDLSNAPYLFLQEVLQAPEFNLPGLVANCPTINNLREQFLPLLKLFVAGKVISNEHSESIRAEAKQLDNHEDVAVRVLATLISTALPVPPLSEQDAWASIFMGLNQLIVLAAQYQDGWSVEDRNMEERRHQWFTERLEETETGQFTDEELNSHHQQWFQENEAYQVKEEAFYDNYEQTLQPVEKLIRGFALDLFKKAPAFVNA